MYSLPLLKFHIVNKTLCPRYVVQVNAPRRGSDDAAGVDLWAFGVLPLTPGAPILLDLPLAPGETICLDTNLSVTLPKGHYGRVAPRSGISMQGVIVNAGVIDRDYTGAIGVVLTNVSSRIVTLNLRRPVAQLIVTPYSNVTPILMFDEDDRKTLRGANGYGSTDEAVRRGEEAIRMAQETLTRVERECGPLTRVERNCGRVYGFTDCACKNCGRGKSIIHPPTL